MAFDTITSDRRCSAFRTSKYASAFFLLAATVNAQTPPDNIRALIDGAFASAGKKGEFESSAEYGKRIAAYLAGKTTFRFLLEEGGLLYNPDRQEWRGLVFPERVVFVAQSLPGRDSLILSRKELASRQFKGTNAFGATTLVTEKRIDFYGIIWEKVGIYFTQVAPTGCGHCPRQQRHI